MSILESAENLAKTLSTAANIKVTDLEQGITGPVETSDVYTMQKEQELENDRQALESPVESSTDWYAKLKKTNLVPQQKSYYFDNTKQIVDGLGIPGISDYDINLYLDNNDLEGLDNLLLDKYKNYQENSRRDSYRNILEAFDMTAAQKIDAIKQLKQKEPGTPLDLKDIIKVRSQITGEVLKNREKNLSSQTSARNDVLEDTAYKTNRIAQLVQKNLKAREERSYLEAFGDFTERSLPGVRFHQTAMQNLLLESLGARNEKGSFLDNLIKSTFTGSSWEEVADNIWELPKEQFDAVMDLIENNPVFARNLFAQGEVLGALLGTSELTTEVTNVLDAVNVLSAARLTKNAFEKGAIKPEVIPPEKGLKGPVIIDADFTVISEEPVRAEASRALTLPQFRNALVKMEAASGRFRQVVGYKYLKDGDFVVRYRYFNNVKDIFEAFKENPNAVIQSVPDTDKFPAGKIREVHAYDSIYAKGYQTIDPKTFFNKKDSKQASARAYAEGSTIEGDLNAGARNTASEKLKKKINDFEKGTGEQPTEEDIFVAEPEILSGAPRNTTANAKILQEPKFTIPTNDQIRNVGPYMNIADLDLNAANKLTEQATNVFDKTMAYLRSQPIDLKVAKVNTQTELGGIITNEVYGIGSQGNSPLDLTFLEAQELTAGGPFRVIQDTNGDIWLSRDNYISYDSGIATPIDYANVEGVNKGFVGDIAQNTRMWSIGASGVPNEIADQTYQAVGYRAGWKDILTNMVQKIEKGVSKKERTLAESIFQEESLRGERFTDEELVAKAGTLTNVVNYVKDVRKFEDLGKSAVNNFERQAIIAEGYKGLTFNKNPFNSEVNTIANDFSGTLIAKKIDEPILSDLQQDFVAYTQNGSVIPPQTKLPFELDKVDVYRLQHSLYNNKWDKVNYVVTPKGDPNAVITKVPEVVIGDQPHAGWGYKDKWFIRFDRTAKDSAGRVRGYTKTAATAKTYKEAVAYVDKFKRIGQVINNYNEGLIGEVEANRAIQKISIEGKYPFVPELQTLQGFLDYLDTRRMTDITNVSELKIGRDVFSPDTAIQLDDGETIAGNNLGSRWKVGKSPLLNPGYSNRLPKRTDLSKYLGDLVNRNASLIGMMPTYQVFARRFAATFGKLVDRTVSGYSDIAFLRDPDRFIRATAQTSKEPLYNQAKTFSRMVNMAMDQANQEPRWNAWVNQQVDKLVKSEFPGYSSLGEVLNNEHNPVKLLTGFLYSTTFALRPAQLVTQTALTTAMALGLNPIKTMKAVGTFIPVLHAMNVIRRGINVESSLEALVKWPAIVERWPGFTAEDLKALALEARNLGYGELSFNDVRNNGVMTKAGNWIHKVVYYPFEEGNQWSRLIGLIVSAERRSSAVKKPIAQFTKQDWAVVAKESDALSGGSSRANKRWAIEEIPGMKQFSMMQSFTLNTWESFFGRKLNMTKLQKLRWAGVMLTLFGLDMFLESKDSETTALRTQDTTGIDYKLAAHGFLGWGLATLFGYEVDVGSNAPRIFGNLYADIVNILADTDDVDTRPYIAATIGRVVNSAKDIYLWLQNPEEYGVKDEHHLTTAQKLTNVGMSLARIWTGLSEAEKLWAATQLNEWRNRAGLDIIPFDEKREDLGYKAFVQYMTGFRPIEETGVRRTALQEAIKKKKEDTATGVTLSKKYWLNYCKALANERIDPKTLAEYEANAFHITALTVQGLTIAEQNETLDAIYKFYNELDKATRDYIAKKNNPWVQDSEAFKQAVEEYKYRIEGTTKPNTEKKEITPSEIGRVRDGRMQLIE